MTTLGTFKIGEVIRTRAHFQSSGTSVAPSTIICKYLAPGAGSPSTATVNTVSTGRYFADIDTQGMSAGTLKILWQGNGTYDAVNEQQCTLEATAIALS